MRQGKPSVYVARHVMLEALHLHAQTHASEIMAAEGEVTPEKGSVGFGRYLLWTKCASWAG